MWGAWPGFQAASCTPRPALRLGVRGSVCQVVFWDLRVPTLEVLYRHHVRGARITPVLDGIDGALSTLCGASALELHPRLAQGLLHAATGGLMRVLIHGGPRQVRQACGGAIC